MVFKCSGPSYSVEQGGGESHTGSGIPRHCRLSAEAGYPGQRDALQEAIAVMQWGAPPLQFMGSIDAANGQLGNRAFMRWVGGFYGGGPGVAAGPGTVPGMPCPARSPVLAAPLQLMPKKHRKKGESAAGAIPEATLETQPGTSSETSAAETAGAPAETPPVAVVEGGPKTGTMPAREEAGEATVSGSKKKKKSRVQVALNTLRAEGVEAFGGYLEAQVGEAGLLHNLVERITRAGDLGDRREAALRVVEERMRRLDPDGIPAGQQAAGSGAGEIAQVAVIAPVRMQLSFREQGVMSCCIKGDVNKLRQLLKFGSVDVNLGTRRGTPLTCSAFCGHTPVARELLSMPAIDVNLGYWNGATPLFMAAQQGHVDLVKLFLAASGINPNLGTLTRKTTPLIIASFKGLEAVVRTLLTARNIKIDLRQIDGATALFASIQNNNPRILEVLVSSGADVNLGLIDGTTPLTRAAHDGSVEILKRLLQAPGILVDKQTTKHVTAIFYAVQQGQFEAARLLLEHGADPELAEENGVTPLHIACLHGRLEIVELLLNAGVDMEREAAGGYTGYETARLAGHQGIMRLIEDRRRDRDIRQGRIEELAPGLQPQEQSLQDRPGETARLSPVETEPATQRVPEREPENEPESRPAPPDPGQAGAASARPPEETPDSPPPAMKPQSPLGQAKTEFISAVLEKLREDWLDPLDGIRVLEQVNTVSDLDGLCAIFNRLAGIERKKYRAGRRPLWRKVPAVEAEGAGAEAGGLAAGAGPHGFELGEKRGLDAEAVEAEVRHHLEQRYHRFVSQAVNDMEFGRGKQTSGYPGVLHASAGIPGVGSCSVFFCLGDEGKLARVVGIGHHLDRGSYRLGYAVDELRGLRTICLK